MSVQGTAGGAVVTSGLATIGSVVGGGMLTGLGVILIIPATLGAVGGIIGMILASKNKKSRDRIKKKLVISAEFTFVILKSKVSNSIRDNNDFTIGVLLSLQALISDLKRDID